MAGDILKDAALASAVSLFYVAVERGEEGEGSSKYKLKL